MLRTLYRQWFMQFRTQEMLFRHIASAKSTLLCSSWEMICDAQRVFGGCLINSKIIWHIFCSSSWKMKRNEIKRNITIKSEPTFAESDENYFTFNQCLKFGIWGEMQIVKRVQPQNSPKMKSKEGCYWTDEHLFFFLFARCSKWWNWIWKT